MSERIFIKEESIHSGNEHFKYVGNNFFASSDQMQRDENYFMISRSVITTLIIIVVLVLSLFYFFADDIVNVNNEFSTYNSEKISYSSYYRENDANSPGKATMFVLLSIAFLCTLIALLLSYSLFKKINKSVVLISDNDRSKLIQNVVLNSISWDKVKSIEDNSEKIDNIKKDIQNIKSAKNKKNNYLKIESKEDYFGKFLSEFIMELNKSIFQLKDSRNNKNGTGELSGPVLIKSKGKRKEDKIIGF